MCSNLNREDSPSATTKQVGRHQRGLYVPISTEKTRPLLQEASFQARMPMSEFQSQPRRLALCYVGLSSRWRTSNICSNLNREDSPSATSRSDRRELRLDGSNLNREDSPSATTVESTSTEYCCVPISTEKTRPLLRRPAHVGQCSVVPISTEKTRPLLQQVFATYEYTRYAVPISTEKTRPLLRMHRLKVRRDPFRVPISTEKTRPLLRHTATAGSRMRVPISTEKTRPLLHDLPTDMANASMLWFQSQPRRLALCYPIKMCPSWNNVGVPISTEKTRPLLLRLAPQWYRSICSNLNREDSPSATEKGSPASAASVVPISTEKTRPLLRC